MKIQIPLFMQRAKATSFFTKLSRKNEKLREAQEKYRSWKESKVLRLKERAKNSPPRLQLLKTLTEITEVQKTPSYVDKEIFVRTFRKLD